MKNSRPSIALILPGGIGTGVNNLGVPVLERLVKLLSKDFEITVFSLFRINKDYSPSGFELVDVSHKISVVRFAKLLITIRRHHKRKCFSTIHGFWALPSGFFAVLLARILKTRSIVSFLGGDAIALPEINYGQLQRPLSRKLIAWTMKYADDVITLTKYLLDNLSRRGLTRDGIHIIPWGIDTELFPFQSKEFESTIQFLHIANLHPVKDQRTLLLAFRLISDQVPAQLTIIGEGVLEVEIKALAVSLNLTNITFVDPMPYERLAEYYRRSDVLLHTSLSEGQSEVVTEAMSIGVVVCGTRVGLMHDEPSCCVAVEIRDHAALANQVLKLLNNQAHYRAIRENAHSWATTHSVHWTVAQLAKLYASE